MIFSLFLNLLTIVAILALLDMIIERLTYDGLFDRIVKIIKAFKETKYRQ